MSRLNGKVALVTGAGRGLGEATARLFLAEGAKVLAADVLVDELAELRRSSDAEYGTGRCLTVHLDVSSPTAWDSAADVLVAELGSLDVLVNNAGVSSPPVGLEAMTLQDWHHVLSVNLTGTMLGMRTTVPFLRRTGGAIINVGSMFGVVGADNSPAYQASKGGVRALTRAAALQYGAEGIRVNSVHPGLTDTALFRAQGSERIEARLERTPLRRVASPEEVARTILFLASEDSSYVTGADLLVDGGYTAC